LNHFLISVQDPVNLKRLYLQGLGQRLKNGSTREVQMVSQHTETSEFKARQLALATADLDKLNIVELVEKFANKPLVYVEGYGGEDKLGEGVVDYILKRVGKESELMPNSHHCYETWDTYNLRRPIGIKTDMVILYINRRKERGGENRVAMVHYKREVEVKYTAVFI